MIMLVFFVLLEPAFAMVFCDLSSYVCFSVRLGFGVRFGVGFGVGVRVGVGVGVRVRVAGRVEVIGRAVGRESA